MDEIYVLARRVLLDALEALASHRNALTLVGAQAIYLRVGESDDLRVAPYTSDGDLAINPALLADQPPLESEMTLAGFFRKSPDAVGIWVARGKTLSGVEAEVPIDLLVPDAAAPSPGRRAARLIGHEERVARRVRGLEGALVDFDELALSALDRSDDRSIILKVAGPAALLVAKLHKLSERAGTHRQSAKDALDVLRLLRGTETADIAARWGALRASSLVRPAAEAATRMLQELFASPKSPGSVAAGEAAFGMDRNEITASSSALASDLLRAVQA